MNSNFLIIGVTAAMLMAIQLPLMIKLFHKLALLDEPDERKRHKKAIPAIGGLVIAMVWVELFLFFEPVRQFWINQAVIGIPLLLLCITGVWDDQKHLSSGKRFMVQILSGVYLVINGITIQDFGGILGIHELPFWFDAIFTVVVVTGITNAFNLIDGIDGLAGGIAFANLIIFSLIAFLAGHFDLLAICLIWSATVLVFLFFNWSPAKVFMGDGGSLVFGFFFVGMGLKFRQDVVQMQGMDADISLAMLAALFIVPVTDTLRVFAYRISQGRSPYSADRNHLHHWIVRNQVPHNMATLQILILHTILLPVSNLLLFIGIPALPVMLIQFGIVLGYTKFVQAITNFNRWYLFIRRYERNKGMIS
ncbi:MAG: MraY family glycosyltransferase [Bacteroidia bacterium]